MLIAAPADRRVTTPPSWMRLGPAVRSQVEEGETDPFDDAMLAGTFGLVDTMKANSSALADIAKTLRKLARTG